MNMFWKRQALVQEDGLQFADYRHTATPGATFHVWIYDNKAREKVDQARTSHEEAHNAVGYIEGRAKLRYPDAEIYVSEKAMKDSVRGRLEAYAEAEAFLHAVCTPYKGSVDENDAIEAVRLALLAGRDKGQ